MQGGNVMPQILIRNLDEEVIDSLKARARRHSRSLQGEVKLILEAISRQPDETPLEVAERWQAYFAGSTISDSIDFVRKDRER
jgi:antitoxin FitA